MKTLILLCWFSFFSLFATTEIATYTFSLDGEALKPRRLSVDGNEAQFSPGDVIYFSRIALCLDEPGHYDFHAKDNVLFRKLADGRLVPVACGVESKREESPPEGQRFRSKSQIVNPLSQWTDEELKYLRGVSLNAWSEEIQNQLTKLDAEHVCLYLDSEVIEAHQGLPQIPEDIRALLLQYSSSSSMDTSRLATFKKLRHLGLARLNVPDFDFAVLKGLPLQYLSLPTAESVKNTEVLSTLTAMKTLLANGISYMGDGRWLSHLTQLESLHTSNLHPSTKDGPPAEVDLSILAELPRLRFLKAQGITITHLPTKTLPQLKQASLLLSKIPQESLDTFIKANPQTNFETRLNPLLAKSLEKADRVLVRKNAPPSTNEDDPEKIHESQDPAEIQELIKNTTVEEAPYGYCMCGGDSVFNYYQGNKLIVTLGFHHGRSLRWSGGAWPEDASLTEESSKYLVEWLAMRGYDAPKKELLQEQRQRAAIKHQQDRYRAILPKEMITSFEKLNEEIGASMLLPSVDLNEEVPWKKKAIALFEDNIPDDKKRASVCLSLLGCTYTSWSESDGIEGTMMNSLLPRIPKDTLHAVILAAPIPSEEALGAVRWMFGEGRAADFQDSPEAFQKLTQFALTHPRQSNRWRTLTVLRDLGTPQARSILRSVMKDGTTPRKLSEEEMTVESFSPGDIALPENTPDSAAAALCLAQLKDTESEAHIQKTRETLPAEAKKK
jgi:hypothetical protein